MEGNKETYVPVKEVTADESIAFMSSLYARCQETRERTRKELADKYLSPLARPAAVARRPAAGKAGKGGDSAKPAVE
jgi:hypothetical protein